MGLPTFRDYAGRDLEVLCVKCWHRTTITPELLAESCGWTTTLDKARERLHCRRCGSYAGEFELGGDEAGAYSPSFRDARCLSATQIALGRSLRRARLAARKTREELTKMIPGGPGELAGVELGYIGVGDAYVKTVLEACGLPSDWLDAETTEP